MFLAALSAFAFAARGAYGYENSSPLFIYSTGSLNIPSIQDLSSASSIQPLLTKSLSQCPTTNYLVLLQQGVSSDDYICPKNTPFLKDRIGASGDKAQTSTMVRDVVGSIDMTDVVSTISTSCNKEPELFDITSFPDFSRAEVQSKVFFVSLPQLYPEASIEDRKAVLQQSDNAISSLVERYFDSKDYTLVYATTSISSFSMREQSSEAHEYEPELPLINVMHGGELVRRNLISKKEKSSNQTIVDGDLFAKYQFLSPGIFMGLLVGFILLSILYVGISALSSLQVTYGAFDKEQGQLAAKKQQ